MTPQAQLLALAHHIAKSEARAAMKEQGIKVQYVEPRDLHRAANALMKEHWQRFLEEAEQKRKAAKSKASTLHMSGAK
jgi:hypothetical protein